MRVRFLQSRFRLQAFVFELAESVDTEALVPRFFGFLDDVAAREAQLLVNVFGDNVVPIGEAVVEFLHALLGLFLLVVVGVQLPLIFLFDPLALGLLRIDGRRLLLVGLLVAGFGRIVFFFLSRLFFL